ncbi:synaptojanin-2-binding protein [Trichomycterus rosablanca]|uniref:synaptojanin-2-binding protein n=1 Tax=Trichomycterus rosablanca TaxID=2290929 RepID=UPI002F3509C2
MNGTAHSSHNAVDIQLKRGPSGLGFNIVGGVDQQYMINDSGIYVAKIKEDGAAALDGRLQEGDKILAINGCTLENLSHGESVELFRSAGEDVVLTILQRPAVTGNGPIFTRPDGDSSYPMAVSMVVLGLAVTAYIIYRRTGYRRHFPF